MENCFTYNNFFWSRLLKIKIVVMKRRQYNLSLGKTYSDEEMFESLKNVGLALADEKSKRK